MRVTNGADNEVVGSMMLNLYGRQALVNSYEYGGSGVRPETPDTPDRKIAPFLAANKRMKSALTKHIVDPAKHKLQAGASWTKGAWHEAKQEEQARTGEAPPDWSGARQAYANAAKF